MAPLIDPNTPKEDLIKIANSTKDSEVHHEIGRAHV